MCVVCCVLCMVCDVPHPGRAAVHAADRSWVCRAPSNASARAPSLWDCFSVFDAYDRHPPVGGGRRRGRHRTPRVARRATATRHSQALDACTCANNAAVFLGVRSMNSDHKRGCHTSPLMQLQSVPAPRRCWSLFSLRFPQRSVAALRRQQQWFTIVRLLMRRWGLATNYVVVVRLARAASTVVTHRCDAAACCSCVIRHSRGCKSRHVRWACLAAQRLSPMAGAAYRPHQSSSAVLCRNATLLSAVPL